jgi:hypothetical protein
MADINQFDLARKRAQQQANVSSQTAKGALERRFAALGGLDSGARIKLENQIDQQTAQQLSDVNEGINAQEQQEAQRQREIQQGREYQTKERESSQLFSAGESQKGREFMTSERLGGQSFASGEADKGRAFTTSERLGTQTFQTGERLGSQTFQTGERLGSQTFQTGERLGSESFTSKESEKGRIFSKSEREAGQKFTTQERLGSESFTSKEAEKGREFTAQQVLDARAYDKEKFDATLTEQKDQFEKTFGEEQAVNESNILFNSQMLGYQDAVPILIKERFGQTVGAPSPIQPTPVLTGSFDYSMPQFPQRGPSR